MYWVNTRIIKTYLVFALYAFRRLAIYFLPRINTGICAWYGYLWQTPWLIHVLRSLQQYEIPMFMYRVRIHYILLQHIGESNRMNSCELIVSAEQRKTKTTCAYLMGNLSVNISNACLLTCWQIPRVSEHICYATTSVAQYIGNMICIYMARTYMQRIQTIMRHIYCQ